MSVPDLAHRRPEATARDRGGLRDGALAMAPLAAGYLPFALVVGVAAGASPQPWAAWAGSLLVYGGSAQLLVTDLVGSGSGLWPAVVAAAVVQARLLVFSTAMAPLLRGASLTRRLLAAVVVIDPLWALVARREQNDATAAHHLRYYAGAGGLLFLVWPVAIGAGALLGRSPLVSGSAPAAMMQMCLPASLAAVVGPYLRTSAGARAVLTAGVVAWVGHDWPAGSALLVAMVGAAVAGAAPGARGGIR